MRKPFLVILPFFLCISVFSFSQDLTGIWRGTFYNMRDLMMDGSKYRYEVQIDNNGRGIKGVTYSYQNTRFYGKASLTGIWSADSKTLTLKEEVMEEIKVRGANTVGCLMTCYLDYRKDGNKEYLEGTYTSRNMNDGSDCGGGKVVIERVTDSDFEKEDFLKTDKEKADKQKVKPGQEEFVVKEKPAVKPAESKPAPIASAKKPTTPKPAPVPKKPEPQPKKADSEVVSQPAPQTVPTKPAVPNVLKERTNELFQTITTSATDIVISFYDNGEIDGDTISVYDNGRLVTSKKGLSTRPITINLKFSDDEKEHEIVMVAENLGSIPPNTALMIVQAGDERHNIHLSSTEQKNAMVRIRHKPK